MIPAVAAWDNAGAGVLVADGARLEVVALASLTQEGRQFQARACGDGTTYAVVVESTVGLAEVLGTAEGPAV